MARRPPPVTPVTWRNGVHLTGTPLWCDARHRREVCFASAEDRVSPGHGQVIATPQTLQILGLHSKDGNLGVPTRQRFTLGTLRLELIPSGRGVGGAALHVDLAGRTVLYAGWVRTTGGYLCDPAEVRACDALVVAAPFGEVHHLFPTLDDAYAQLASWLKARIAEGGRPVLAVDSVGDALEIGTMLSERDQLSITGAPPLQDAADAIARGGMIGPVGRERDAVVLRIEGERVGGRAQPTALVSPRVIDGGTSRHAASFVWPSAAGRTDLLSWIEATSARAIYVTGACADAIVEVLGPRARTIGPPRQMKLFEAG